MSKQRRTSSLQTIQNHFAIYDSSGDIWMVDQNEIAEIRAGKEVNSLSFYKKAPAELKIKRFCEKSGFQDDPKQLINQFWISPNTHVFKKTAFSPIPMQLDVINFWVGPSEAVMGDWTEIRAFLLAVICDRNETVFKYLLRYLAHMLQHPEEKPGIMLVLLGAQGTGKGTFFKLLGKIWPRTTLEVNDVDHVVGNFNAVLEQKYIVCMDEALFAGDRKKLERLKSLITEPSCRIEQKYQPARIIDSYHRFIAASNNDQFAHIELDDRRFLFLRVANSMKGNNDYFNDLLSHINDPIAIGSMIFDLINMDLTSFNIRKRPSTDEHTNQKIQSLTGFDRYWFEVLQAGSLSGSDEPYMSEWDQPEFAATHTLTQQYKNFDKNSERYASTQGQYIAARLSKLCPSAKAARGKKSAHSDSQVRGYNLPSLSVARQEFEVVIGSSIYWADIVTQEVLRTIHIHEGAHP